MFRSADCFGRLLLIRCRCSSRSACTPRRATPLRRKKIDEAIDNHYLATEFEKAEVLLIGVHERLRGPVLSPQVMGKRVDVRRHRARQRQDIQAGAQEAFQQAPRQIRACSSTTHSDRITETDNSRDRHQRPIGRFSRSWPSRWP